MCNVFGGYLWDSRGMDRKTKPHSLWNKYCISQEILVEKSSLNQKKLKKTERLRKDVARIIQIVYRKYKVI